MVHALTDVWKMTSSKKKREVSIMDKGQRPIRHLEHKEFAVGDYAMIKIIPDSKVTTWFEHQEYRIKGKLEPRYAGPYLIKKKISPVVFVLEVDNFTAMVHEVNMKPYTGRKDALTQYQEPGFIHRQPRRLIAQEPLLLSPDPTINESTRVEIRHRNNILKKKYSENINNELQFKKRKEAIDSQQSISQPDSDSDKETDEDEEEFDHEEAIEDEDIRERESGDEYLDDTEFGGYTFTPIQSRQTHQKRQPPIFCDLDGVFTDFERGVKRVLGKSPHSIHPKILWSNLTQIPNFYTNLPWMQDGRDFWETIRILEPIILTGVPYGSWAENQKREWVNRELGEEVQVITCHNKDKYKCCLVPDAILIDDQVTNRELWERSGGIFILHKSAADTISQLQNHGLLSQLSEMYLGPEKADKGASRS